MCKWWKDNFDSIAFEMNSRVWKIMVSSETYYEGFYLADIRFCPGCGHILDKNGCTNTSLNADAEAKIYSDIAMKGE